jgi:hypothetical protein
MVLGVGCEAGTQIDASMQTPDAMGELSIPSTVTDAIANDDVEVLRSYVEGNHAALHT